MSCGARKFPAITIRIALVTGAAVLLLGGCAGGGNGRSGPSAGIATNAAAPVQLGAAGTAGAASKGSVLGPLNETLLRKSIENYRISKKRAQGRYQFAGADLNGDGVPEALVLFQGKDWCTKTGCSLVIFQSFQYGFRPISRIVRVKPPVEITDNVTNTYRDLLVQTGGGPAPERRVRLLFSGSDYSRNAMLQTEVPLGTAVRTETAIAEAPVPAATTVRR